MYRVIRLGETDTDADGLWDVVFGVLIGSSAQTTISECCSTPITRAVTSLFAKPQSNPQLLKGRATALSAGATLEDIAKDIAIGTRNRTDLKLHTTNFKRLLLANTEVLTIGSHHSCACGLIADEWATLFPNLKTLRISPSKSDNVPFLLKHACDKLLSDGDCPLLTSLKPRKLVLRNVDGTGFYNPRSSRWNIGGLETVVCFIPVDDREYHNGRLFYSLMSHFNEAKDIKIVVYDRHEGKIRANELRQRAALSRVPINPDVIMGILCAAVMNQHPTDDMDDRDIPVGHDPFLLDREALRPRSGPDARKCTIYGVETFTFDLPQSFQIHDYRDQFPGQRFVMDRKKVVEIIKKEVPSQSLFFHAAYPDQPFDLEAWERGNDNVVFRTLADYHKAVESRSAEISAED